MTTTVPARLANELVEWATSMGAGVDLRGRLRRAHNVPNANGGRHYRLSCDRRDTPARSFDLRYVSPPLIAGARAGLVIPEKASVPLKIFPGDGGRRTTSVHFRR